MSPGRSQQSFFALIATGDASIAAAKANGGITEVSAVDHTARNILGIYGEFCTIVKGR
ncbi:MAG TPA: TRL domain-containing protein, partial [Thermodesulfobacteriota bacterium]